MARPPGLSKAEKIASTVFELELGDTEEIAKLFEPHYIALFRHIKLLWISDYLLEKLENKDIFKHIIQFDQLETLKFTNCHGASIPWCVEMFLLPSLKQVVFKTYDTTLYQQIMSKIIKEQYPMELRRTLFYLVDYLTNKDKKPLESLTTTQLIAAYTCHLPDLPELHVEIENELTRRNYQPLVDSPLSANSLVLLLGKFQALTSLKASLDKQGIKTVTSYKPTVTHVAVGVGSKVDLTGIETLPLIPEQQLQIWLHKNDTPYLMKESSLQSGLNEKVIDLLSAKDIDIQMTAMEMVKSGGVTPEVMSHLVFLRYTSKNAKVINKAKALIKQYGSSALRIAIVEDRHLSHVISLKNVMGEWTNFVELRDYDDTMELIQGGDLNPTLFSELLFNNAGHGRKYLLDFGTSPQRKSVIERSLKEFGMGKGMQTLCLAGLKLKHLPDEIAEFPQIRILDCTGHQLTTIPSAIGKLQLEEVNLLTEWDYALISLPAEFYSLPLTKLKITIKNEQVVSNDFSKLPLRSLVIGFELMKDLPLPITKIGSLIELEIQLMGGLKNSSFSADTKENQAVKETAQSLITILIKHAPALQHVKTLRLPSGVSLLNKEVTDLLKMHFPNCWITYLLR